MRKAFALLLLAVCAAVLPAQKRLVLVDQDGAGPGGSDQMSILALLQAPDVQVLGITIVTGDAWRDEEALHTLRMLELTGHTDVPVARGAVFPLVRTQQETRLEEALIGKAAWLGAWGRMLNPHPDAGAGAATAAVAKPEPQGPYDIPPLPEGPPKIKPIDEDAAHFLIRQVRAHPHQVTVYAAGPLTNIALAISIDPEFASLTKGIVLMGGSLRPQTSDPEYAADPRHEFNFWFDPEAAHIVLRADWPRIDATTDDVTVKAPFTQQMLDAISKSSTPAARYIAAWSQRRTDMWDELTACAWLDPAIITKETDVYMDVNLSHGPSYGDTLTWPEAQKPATGVRLVHAQLDLDLPRFQKEFVDLMTRTP
ncbi:MAG: nucleoside hydrolase [Terracidiphilus sp.]|jgi:inosine-uridine nucleoside N-ribohydrolase